MNKKIKKFELHSLHIVLLLIVTAFLGTVGVGELIQKNALIKQFDVYFYELIHHGHHYKILDILINPFNFDFLPLSTNWSSYIVVMVLLFLLYIFIKKRSLFPWVVIAILIGSLLTYYVTIVNWQYVHRDRPFLSLPNVIDQSSKDIWKHWSSYPSGHTRETALYATIIAAFIPGVRWYMAVFVVFIAYSRVYLGAHYPTDVLAGVALGFLNGRVGVIIARELQLMFKKKKTQEHKTIPTEKPINEKQN